MLDRRGLLHLGTVEKPHASSQLGHLAAAALRDIAGMSEGQVAEYFSYAMNQYDDGSDSAGHQITKGRQLWARLAAPWWALGAQAPGRDWWLEDRVVATFAAWLDPDAFIAAKQSGLAPLAPPC